VALKKSTGLTQTHCIEIGFYTATLARGSVARMSGSGLLCCLNARSGCLYCVRSIDRDSRRGSLRQYLQSKRDFSFPRPAQDITCDRPGLLISAQLQT